jgi:hypothetical protein
MPSGSTPEVPAFPYDRARAEEELPVLLEVYRFLRGIGIRAQQEAPEEGKSSSATTVGGVDDGPTSPG